MGSLCYPSCKVQLLTEVSGLIEYWTVSYGPLLSINFVDEFLVIYRLSIERVVHCSRAFFSVFVRKQGNP